MLCPKPEIISPKTLNPQTLNLNPQAQTQNPKPSPTPTLAEAANGIATHFGVSWEQNRGDSNRRSVKPLQTVVDAIVSDVMSSQAGQPLSPGVIGANNAFLMNMGIAERVQEEQGAVDSAAAPETRPSN